MRLPSVAGLCDALGLSSPFILRTLGTPTETASHWVPGIMVSVRGAVANKTGNVFVFAELTS